jgi:hypothetical protein
MLRNADVVHFAERLRVGEITKEMMFGDARSASREHGVTLARVEVSAIRKRAVQIAIANVELAFAERPRPRSRSVGGPASPLFGQERARKTLAARRRSTFAGAENNR